MELQTYASKSTAIRGAKRMGLLDPDIERTEEGRWFIKRRPDPEPEPEPVATGAQPEAPKIEAPETGLQPIASPGTADLNNPESIIPRRTGTPESYHDLAVIAPAKSKMKSTGVFIWAFLDLNPDLGRKEAISLLVKNGCNINTSRTQYQLWWTDRKQRE